MQLDKNMLNRLLTMNDDQLTSFIQKIASESGIDPAVLGINPNNIQSIRQALGGATEEDIRQLNAVYEDYNKNRRRR